MYYQKPQKTPEPPRGEDDVERFSNLIIDGDTYLRVRDLSWLFLRNILRDLISKSKGHIAPDKQETPFWTGFNYMFATAEERAFNL